MWCALQRKRSEIGQGKGGPPRIERAGAQLSAQHGRDF